MDLPNELLILTAAFLNARDISSLQRTTHRLATLLDSQLCERARSHICADGAPVLIWAAKRGKAPLIRKLFRNAGMHRKSEPDPSVVMGREANSIDRALQVAAGNGHENVVRLLLELGANVAATDSEGETALHAAAGGGDMGINAAAARADGEAVDSPVSSGHETVVRLLLEKGADVQAALGAGETPLHYASSSGNITILNLLLDGGASASSVEHYRESTPLHFAALYNNEWAIKPLLENSADVMDQDFVGHTPLHFAAENGNIEAVRLLLEYGADATASVFDEPDQTPLYYAEGNDAPGAVVNILREAART
ncbi:Ankyrin repeat protein [Aspergillus sp. HF37]|nr:Ankyrin repeat protein [Aspergillus sp. HF37]